MNEKGRRKIVVTVTSVVVALGLVLVGSASCDEEPPCVRTKVVCYR